MAAVRSFQPELLCLLGHPVAENPTSYMLERAFATHGLDWRYIQCDVPPARLADAVRGLRALGFRGGNCTIPHKVAVIEHLDRLSPAAKLVGAVNCLVRAGDELIGENTDGKGFLTSLSALAKPAGMHVAILGAGGAARAIAGELALAGVAEITIVNRHRGRGEELVQMIEQRTNVPARYAPWQGDYLVPRHMHLLVKATPVGMFPQGDQRVEVADESLHPGLIVCDAVINPPDTGLLRRARAQGATALDGLGMLVNQGVIGFRMWTGIDPDPQVMRQALEEVFQP